MTFVAPQGSDSAAIAPQGPRFLSFVIIMTHKRALLQKRHWWEVLFLFLRHHKE
jgi:hypothetical protein